jgi:RimJ/RimL family protein N-acetyltransferase
VKHETTPLDIRGERVRVRWWHSPDDTSQRRWSNYTDPCNALWNIPRNTGVYQGLLSLANGNGSYMRYVWAIDMLPSTLIGRISLRDVDQPNRRARLGISIGAPYVGQRLGTEAMRLFLPYFFDTLGFTTMVLDVAAFNRRAVRCYERLGFRYVGQEWRRTSSDHCLRHLEDSEQSELLIYFRRDRAGLWVQFFDMELTRDEWVAREPDTHRSHSANLSGS